MKPGYVGALTITLFSAAVHAQEPAAVPPSPNGSDKPGLFSGVGSKVGKAFSRPLHPVVQGVASGGGLGVGLGYDFPSAGRWETSTKAVVTLHRYWNLQFDSGYHGTKVQVGGYTRVRDMSRLSFFGSGPDTDGANRTAFTLRDPVVGAVALVKVAPGVAIGGRAEEMWPRVSAGRDPVRPSLEELFGEADAPGLTDQARFGRYQGFIEFTAPAAAGRALNQGGRYRVTYDLFDDQQLDRFDFHRLQLEARHTFAVVRPYHSLTLHGWVSSAEARDGHQVPFFLQHTLGGTGNLRSVDETLIGGDGTAGTLRAFPNFRFRDNHQLLLQAEYRIPVWGPVDATVFADAGKAASRRADLNLSDLERGYGFSVSMMRSGSTAARVTVGFGGGEGSRVFVSLGGLLQ
jgi:hypothetical protein